MDYGFDFQAPATSKPYLGDYAVVQKIVKDFADDAFTIIHEFSTGVEGAENHESQMRDLCIATGNIFMGRSDDYEAAPWQNPERLGAYLRHAVASIKGDVDPGSAFFEWVAVQLIKCSKSLDRGMAEEQAGPMLKELLDDVVNRMLGVQL